MGAPFKVSVGSTPIRIVDYSKSRTVVMIYNNSNNTIYIGIGKGLSVQNGFPVYGYQGMVIAREFGDDPTLSYYAICESGTADVRVWEGHGETLGFLIKTLLEVMRR